MLGRILLFVGGLVVVALFAALLAPLFLDWTNFRSNFEMQASRILGKKVTVNGEVEARILPFPSVTLHDVVVGPDENGETLVHIARFSMDAELAPFLSGEARIFSMHIDQPKIHVRLLENGQVNWLRGSRPSIPARQVVLENVEISNGSIAFIDDQTGRTREITGLDADLSAKSLAGPWSASGHAVLDGEASKFGLSTLAPDPATGDIPLHVRLFPDDRPFDVDLDGDLKSEEGRPSYVGKFAGEWRSEPATDKTVKPATGPKVRGEFELTNDRVRIPTYQLDLGDADNPYAVTGEATLDTGAKPEFLLTADGQQIDVNRIGNGGQQGKTGRNGGSSARERLMQLLSRAAEIPIPTVPGHATLRLPAIVAGDTVVRNLQLDVRPDGSGWQIDKAVAVLPGRTQLEASGKLALGARPSFQGNLLVASRQPSGLSTWLAGNVDPAIRQLASLGFSARVDLRPELQRLDDLELAIGDADLKGRMERQSPATGQPNLSFDLTGNALDLDALQAVYSLVAGENNADSFFAHQIAARLKVGNFKALGIEAHDVDTVFSLGGDGLNIDRLQVGDLAGARISGNGQVTGSLFDYRGRGDLSLHAADPSAFFAMLKDHLPAHPALTRLAENASWFVHADLDAGLNFEGGKAGSLTVNLGGTVNGSRVTGRYRADDLLALTSDTLSNLDLTLQNPDSTVLLGQLGLRPLPLPGDGSGRLTLKANAAGSDITDGSLDFYTDGGTRFDVKGAVSLASDSFLAGTGDVTLESPDLDPYLVMNGIALPPSLDGLPVKGHAKLALKDNALSIDDLLVTADGNSVSGKLGVALGGLLPTVTGSLKASDVDLEWLVRNAFGTLRDPKSGTFSKAAFGQPSFAGTAVTVQFTSDRFTPGLLGAIGNASGTLTAKDGSLAIEDLSGDWLGGKMKGRVSLTNVQSNGFLQSKIDLTNGALADALPLRDGRPPASGRFDLTLIGESSGTSVNDLIYGINGSGKLSFKDLAVNRFNLGLLPKLLQQTDARGGTISAETVEPDVERMLASGDTWLGNVTVPFNLTDGVFRMQDVAAKTKGAGIRADGQLALRGAKLDAAVDVSLDPGDDALQGADPSFRLSLAGPVTDPKPTLDVSSLSNYLSLRAYERERRRVETLQSNLLEKQRLRREVALYKFNDAARAKAAEMQKAQDEEEKRLRAIAEQRNQQMRDAEKARQIDIAPLLDLERPSGMRRFQNRPNGSATPPALQFDGLPGLN
ncbi:AsmA family protein [Rhizobium halophytocola]|uniref:Uncharacterized protein involved in outer membrane biogenesis n=1 Tax=Rhizobium halophytocola TaxID=735519 RepID=A0ABS4E6H1_9HYPH|nr:AsmA family protein [Rhizobium halophytocola]MBP1853521.1 uncharacterized protein involved in outer membrane biogenesis [Rhizobium halophytocola]